MIVRHATPADTDAMHAIDRASFTQPWARASLEEALADTGRSVTLVAEEDGAVQAFGIAWSIGDEGEIGTLAVQDASRGKGLGESMVRALTERLAERGVRKVYLEVRPSNAAARRLYSRLNFTEVGRRPNYYADGEAAIIMQLQLDD